jgi:hypothetical protein
MIWDGWYADLRAVAPGILPRVTHARASGQAVVEFSIDELKAFAALVAKIADHCKPKYIPAGQPGVHASYGRSPGRRRGWINR